MTPPPQGALIIAVNGRWHRSSTLAIPARYAYEQNIPLHLIACVVHEQDRDRPDELQDLFLRSAAVITSQYPDLALSIELKVQPTATDLTTIARECNARGLGLGPALIAQPECATFIQDVTGTSPCTVAIYPNRSTPGVQAPVVVALSPTLPDAALREAIDIAGRFAASRDLDIHVVAPAAPQQGRGLFRRKATPPEPDFLRYAHTTWPSTRVAVHHCPAGATLVGTALAQRASMVITSLPDAAQEAQRRHTIRPATSPTSADITDEEITNLTTYGFLAAAGMTVVLLPTELTGHG